MADSSPTSLPELPGLVLRERLGRGGSATVYLAEQRSVAAGLVAVKVLDAVGDDAEQPASAEFSREANAVRRLRHPNIVRVYDHGREGVWQYLVTEYLPGGDLKARIQRGLSVDECFDLARQLADALRVAHATGIVHRDVKPENVLFRRSGTPVLTDFGIAAAVNDEGKTGADAAGTPLYMSPEQVEARPLDHRTDYYSLGAMLFEMLTGGPPYQFDSQEAVMFAHVHQPIPNLPPSLAELQGLIGTLMAKLPDARPSDGEAVLELIDEYWLVAPRGDAVSAAVVRAEVEQVAAATPPPDPRANPSRANDSGWFAAAGPVDPMNDSYRNLVEALARSLEDPELPNGPPATSLAEESTGLMHDLMRARECLEVGDYDGGRKLLAALATSSDPDVAKMAGELLAGLKLR